MIDPVDISKLMVVGGLADFPAQALSAISHGAVTIDGRTIGLSSKTLDREALCDVTISCRGKSMYVSSDARSFRRSFQGSLL